MKANQISVCAFLEASFVTYSSRSSDGEICAEDSIFSSESVSLDGTDAKFRVPSPWRGLDPVDALSEATAIVDGMAVSASVSVLVRWWDSSDDSSLAKFVVEPSSVVKSIAPDALLNLVGRYQSKRLPRELEWRKRTSPRSGAVGRG